MADDRATTVVLDADIAPLRQALADARSETASAAAELSATLADDGGQGFDLLSAAARKSSSTIEKTLVAAIEGSSVDWTKTISSMVSQLGTLAIQSTVINPLTSLLSGSSASSSSGSSSSSSSLGSLFSSVVNTLLGGTRASGGTVADDKPYLVGEQGPEIFVPRESGRIVPNGEANAQWGAPARAWTADPSLSALLDGTRASGGAVAEDQSYLVGEQGPEVFVPRNTSRITPDGQSTTSSLGGSAGMTHVTVNVQTHDAQSFQRSQGQISASVARVLQSARRYN